ncbi:2S albumin precursor, putative [Ricinus communis]|uniref:2S albumin, putative n=1 Tax=Ricinus communis TaxID=3988 RepID=B9SA33_RICCO|nr:2S albumin precursor, putative [Ricinus communis]|eukprot:XP_002522852.1 2S albumin-like [Ricinus communis]
MAKLIPTVTLISVLLVIIANASFAYGTTIEIDDTKAGGEGSRSQQCHQEFQRKDLSSCEQYIRQSSSRRSPGEELLRMPRAEDQQQETQQLQQCCNQVEQLRHDCQCEAIKSIAEYQIQQGHLQGEESERVGQRASDIVSSCGLRCLRQIQKNPNQEGCRQHIIGQQKLRQCQEYITQQYGVQRSRRSDSNQQQSLRRCCDQIKQMYPETTQCRCEALYYAVEEKYLQGQVEEEYLFDAFKTARYLPLQCGVEPRECQ